MSKPRPVLPGKTYLITRRCAQRQFLLIPYPWIKETFLYCLAVATARHGMRLHAFCCLSNHYHLVLTDPRGELPAFMHWFDGTLARALNSRHGRWENFWAPGTYSRVELVDDADVIDKIVYTLSNPVAAGLVSRGVDWPGVRSGTLKQGRQRIVARRPEFFFSKKMPERVELFVEPPPGSWDSEERSFGEILHARVLEREGELRREFARSGRQFLGPRGVLAQSPGRRPRTPEVRRALKPLYAARDKWRRIERLREHKSFLAEYAAALRRFAAGIRDVIFPAGTYWLRLHAGVMCRAPP